MTAMEQAPTQDIQNPEINWKDVGHTLDQLDSSLEISDDQKRQVEYLAQNLTLKPKQNNTSRDEYLLSTEVDGQEVTKAVGPHIGRRVMNYAAAWNEQSQKPVLPLVESTPLATEAPAMDTSEQPVAKSSDQLISKLPANDGVEPTGDYSSIGNRHTYRLDEGGKSRVVKRSVALTEAELANNPGEDVFIGKNGQEVTNSIALHKELADFIDNGDTRGFELASKALLKAVRHDSIAVGDQETMVSAVNAIEAGRVKLGLKVEDIIGAPTADLPPPAPWNAPFAAPKAGDKINDVLPPPAGFAPPKAEDRVEITPQAVDTPVRNLDQIVADFLEKTKNTDAAFWAGLGDIPTTEPAEPLLPPAVDAVEADPVTAKTKKQKAAIAAGIIAAGTLKTGGELVDNFGKAFDKTFEVGIAGAQAIAEKTKRVGYALATLGSRIANRERTAHEPMSKKKKVAFGLGAVATVLGASYVAYKFNVFGDNPPAPRSGGVSANDLERITDVPTINPPAGGPSSEALTSLSTAVTNRTNEIINTPGGMPWSKAHELYGDQATPRLIQAVEKLQAQGVNIGWNGDPLTDTGAQIVIDGVVVNTETAMSQLAGTLAEQDLANFLQPAA